MPLRKVRYAAISYEVPDEKGRERTVTHYRGETVDIPDDVLAAKGWDAERATVDPDFPLDKPGQLIPLGESMTDEELVHWVASANAAEIKAAAAQRPDLAMRIDGARIRVAEAARTRDELLGVAANTALEYAPDGTSLDYQGDIFIDQVAAGGGGADLAALVAGSVDEVSDYLAEHPDQADAVLAAETEHRSGRPRQGVVKAAETAAQYSHR